MRRPPGMFKIPLPLAGALIFLGIGWVGIAWAFNVGLWILGLVFAAIYALIVRRVQVSITLEPWSKERGMVLWTYRKKQKPNGEPFLIWDEPRTVSEPAPETRAAVSDAPPLEETLSVLAADQVEGRPLPFPPPSSTVAPAPEDSEPEAAPAPEDAWPQAAPAAEAAPAPRDTWRKICPDCAETVLSEARVCRYCGYRFEPAADSVSPGSN